MPQQMLDQLRAWLGADFAEVAGATFNAHVPLSTSLINRVIDDHFSRSTSGKISAAVVEAHDGDRLTVHLRTRVVLLPSVEVRLQIVSQPEFPSAPVLVLRWSVAGGLGVLARFATPIVGLFNVLPPGVRIDGDLVGIDLVEVLRSKALDWVVPLVRQVRVNTAETVVRVGLTLAR
jgi:hypothetical protein